MWYAAHAIFYFRHRGKRRQNLFVVWENIYLVNARTYEEARHKATQIATEECVDDPTLTVDGCPAEYVFAGIRETVEVSHRGKTNALRSGDEITYLVHHLPDLKSVKRLASGQEVSMHRL
jgi:hypothetical protein